MGGSRRLKSFQTPGVRLSVVVCAVIVLLESFGETQQVSATPGKVFFSSGSVQYEYKVPDAGDTLGSEVAEAASAVVGSSNGGKLIICILECIQIN